MTTFVTPREVGELPSDAPRWWRRMGSWAGWWFAPINPVGAKDYRPDIDALRAVAVFLVIAYHLGLRRWSGGFVGVDVFFVISGYLIGSLILGEMELGRFSIAGFYARRIRRILPALITVLIATSVAAYLWLYPHTLSEYGLSLAAAGVSLSNFYFWQNTGYLAGIGTTRALLHTWSLGVEEQFYILLPPFLMLVRRFGRSRPILWVGLASLASFAASVIGVYINANTAFYLAHTRAWELLLGVLIAQGAFPRIPSAWMRAALALAGFAVAIGSAFWIVDATHFPGLEALPPCLGAAMVIAAHADGDSLVRRALAFRPIVFVGLISYSLYLWHWPIIILGRSAALLPTDKFTAVPIAEILGLSFLLATLTWLCVERPFRRAPAPRRVVFAAAGVGVGLVCAVGLTFYFGHGLPGRFSPQVNKVADYVRYPFQPVFRSGTCFLERHGYDLHNYSDFKPEICLAVSDAKPNVLLIGDSFAAHLYAGLSTVLTGAQVQQATVAACKTSLGYGNGDEACLHVWKDIFERFLPTHKVDLVVISGHWFKPDFRDLGQVLDWGRAHGVRMLVIGRPPDYDAAVPILIAESLRRGDPALVDRHRHPGLADLDREFEAFVTAHGARYASAYQALCKGGVCEHMTASGAPVQFDSDHMTREGSVLLIQRLAQQGAFRTDR